MLDAANVAELAEAAAAPDQPRALLRAVERVASMTLRHSLFTVTRFDEELMEVERLYSSDPGAYPLGGRKKKRDTPWGEHVLIARKAFVGEGEAAIRAAFDDHALILGLGLRSVINVPIVIAGSCRGTANFLFTRATLSPDDIATARLLALLAAQVL